MKEGEAKGAGSVDLGWRMFFFLVAFPLSFHYQFGGAVCK